LLLLLVSKLSGLGTAWHRQASAAGARADAPLGAPPSKSALASEEEGEEAEEEEEDRGEVG